MGLRFCFSGVESGGWVLQFHRFDHFGKFKTQE